MLWFWAQLYSSTSSDLLEVDRGGSLQGLAYLSNRSLLNAHRVQILYGFCIQTPALGQAATAKPNYLNKCGLRQFLLREASFCASVNKNLNPHKNEKF